MDELTAGKWKDKSLEFSRVYKPETDEREIPGIRKERSEYGNCLYKLDGYLREHWIGLKEGTQSVRLVSHTSQKRATIE